MNPSNSVVSKAEINDLDLSKPEDLKIWQNRLQAVSDFRLTIQRERFVQMGLISENGDVQNNQLPPDMNDRSFTSTDTVLLT